MLNRKEWKKNKKEKTKVKRKDKWYIKKGLWFAEIIAKSSIGKEIAKYKPGNLPKVYQKRTSKMANKT